MPRATASSDVFSAIAEPRRREIIETLSRSGARPVGDLVAALGVAQPVVSKHLAVLREVGIVSVTRRGRQRMYELEAGKLRPVHEWIRLFERFWTQQLDRVKARAERIASERPPRRGGGGEQSQGR